MPTLSIESNGMLEKTAVYYNGSQISGIKELLVNIDEEGLFDCVIQYEGSDKKLYTKQIFTDTLTNVRTVPASFSEEEAQLLQLLTIESDGDVESSTLFLNEEPLDGVVSLYLHIKVDKNKDGISSIFKKKQYNLINETFKSEITFRNEDDSLETEDIFLWEKQYLYLH